ncbi:MAG: hypothetical protein RJA02_759 [Armatimonadota bacterium]|jgi:3-dehydroquinate dehydratase-2
MQLSPSGPIKVLVIHGPNLNLLGTREPDVYGSVTFYELNELIVQEGKRIGCEVRIEQSNHEGVLIDQIHDARDWADAIVINAGAYTHTSIAIADALRAVRLPTIEVHLSNVHSRETYRHVSYLASAVTGQISGFGPHSYLLAISAAKRLVDEGRF